MKLLVFGATGSIGRHLTAQAIAAGHDVTTFSRKGTDAPGSAADVKGDVLSPDDVDRAMAAGHDAVIVALGNGARGNLRAPGTANIIRAMKKHGPHRLIVQSTLGAGDSRGALNFYWKHVMFGLLLRAAMADHNAQEKLVRNSGLDWTILRPSAFTDGPLGGDYVLGFENDRPGLKLKIARADVAAVLLSLLAAPKSLGRALSLSA